MDHREAIQEMAAERYLLNELAPEVRDAFEAHFFDCAECALDLRAAAAFVDEAKVQLPALVDPPPVVSPVNKAAAGKREKWLSWWRPAFNIPVFAALLLVVGYQNLVTLPALRTEANQPRLLPLVALRGATRGGAGTAIPADRKHGLALPIDVSAAGGAEAYPSYSFDLTDAQGNRVWTGEIAAPPAGEQSGRRLLLAIPGAMLQSGTYRLAVTGVGQHGERTPMESLSFALSMSG